MKVRRSTYLALTYSLVLLSWGGGPEDRSRAVAAGRVVYADWMRGFGNLLIVDHGENFLTIYGNNEALLVKLMRAGQRHILIDLKTLPNLDSTELGRLIRCHLAVRQAGGR